MPRTRTRTHNRETARAIVVAPTLADAYVRVSTEEQALGGVSLDAQEARVRAYCQTQGLTLRTIHRDEGVSASTPLASRPAGARLAAAAAAGEVAHVVAVKLDRCFRNAVDCVQTAEAWTRVGLGLHLIDLGGQAVDTRTPMGRFFLHIMAAVAEMELNQIRDRTRTALRHKMSRGELVGAPALGFRQATPGGAVAADLDELRAVARILELCEADMTFSAVAATLERENIPTKRGGQWCASTVHQVWARRARYTRAFTESGLMLPELTP